MMCLVVLAFEQVVTFAALNTSQAVTHGINGGIEGVLRVATPHVVDYPLELILRVAACGNLTLVDYARDRMLCHVEVGGVGAPAVAGARSIDLVALLAFAQRITRELVARAVVPDVRCCDKPVLR